MLSLCICLLFTTEALAIITLGCADIFTLIIAGKHIRSALHMCLLFVLTIALRSRYCYEFYIFLKRKLKLRSLHNLFKATSLVIGEARIRTQLCLNLEVEFLTSVLQASVESCILLLVMGEEMVTSLPFFVYTSEITEWRKSLWPVKVQSR